MLSEKIINLRKSRGWSQEELAEKLDVSRQSVSKWESGVSNPELDKIVAMSTLFGVSTDYLLKDGTAEDCEPIRDFAQAEEKEETGSVFEEPVPTHEVTVTEAEEYITAVKKAGPRIALGVLLCILSPVALILFGALSDMGMFMGENIAAACGFVALFAFVGAALMFFIPAGMSISKYEYLEKNILVLPEALEKSLHEEYEEKNKKQLLSITAGILCCVFAALLVVFVACLFAENEPVIELCLPLLFVFAAVGVYIIVRTCFLRGAYQRLLQVEEYTERRKKRAMQFEIVTSSYWTIVLVIYLGISFLTHRWDITWLIWILGAAFSTPVETFFARRGRK